jgi:hypothetical protein
MENVSGYQQDVLRLLLKDTILQRFSEKLKALQVSEFKNMHDVCEQRVYNVLN